MESSLPLLTRRDSSFVPPNRLQSHTSAVVMNREDALRNRAKVPGSWRCRFFVFSNLVCVAYPRHPPLKISGGTHKRPSLPTPVATVRGCRLMDQQVELEQNGSFLGARFCTKWATKTWLIWGLSSRRWCQGGRYLHKWHPFSPPTAGACTSWGPAVMPFPD